jgi:hypothetical protein
MKNMARAPSCTLLRLKCWLVTRIGGVEPKRIFRKIIRLENGFQGAFNWLDCLYIFDVNAYD